jgi:hypothetical protein
VVRHTSKAPRPLEAERTDGIVGEEDGTLDGFCGFFVPPLGVLRTYRFQVHYQHFKSKSGEVSSEKK